MCNQSTKPNTIPVYWTDSDGGGASIKRLDWSNNDVVTWLKDHDIEVPEGDCKDLEFLNRVRGDELQDMIFTLTCGTEVHLSEISAVDTDTDLEPNVCPKCGHDNLDCGQIQTVAGLCWRDVTCFQCGLTWTENFAFSSWETDDKEMLDALAK